ncbi:MAG: hypothetical protein E7652_06310 [Ruminococcaceae bacterium]|nr:hypothetical protein [Oscillospiraceae bacterium]
MKWFLYYTVSLIVNFTMIVIFRTDINVDVSSASPAFLLILSAFMSAYFYTNRKKEDFGTNYYSDIGFTDDEWITVSLYACRSCLACIPLYIPFIFFFDILIKSLVPVLIFIISMIGGVVFYRIKFRKELHSRFENEIKELEAQKKREESGKWKQ